MLKKSTKKKIKKGVQKTKRVVRKYATKMHLRRSNPDDSIAIEYDLELFDNDDLLISIRNLSTDETIVRIIKLDPNDEWFLPKILRIFRFGSLREFLENQTSLSDRIYEISLNEWQKLKKLPIDSTSKESSFLKKFISR